MDDESYSPSPEERELTPADESPSNSEQIGNSFEEQVKSDLNGLNHEIVALDKTRFYVSTSRTFESGTVDINRIYGAVDPSTGADNISFRNLSRAGILSGENKSVMLVKMGREPPRSLSPDYFDPEVKTEWEQLRFENVFEQMEPPNKEAAAPSVGYDYKHIKGSEVGFSVTYDSDGKLNRVASYKGPHGFATHYSGETIKQTRSSQQSEGDLTFSESEGKYIFTLNDEGGKTHYVVKIPEAIEIPDIVEKTLVDLLQKRPDLPPEADDKWRQENFPELMGIEIVPELDDLPA